MCEICNIENGGMEFLVGKDANITFGSKTLVEADLAVYINKDKDGYYRLETGYYAEDYEMATIEIPIDFCPFCGRKLKKHIRMEFPWWKE